MAAGAERPLGRRETAKVATRAALQQAANRLFEAQGYDRTTVQEIANAAGVTERTFFRYFGSKDELLADLILGGLPLLQEMIVRRPQKEPPLTAVRNAVLASVDAAGGRGRPTLAQMFEGGPPGLRLQSAGAGLLLRFEAAVADALRQRTSGSAQTGTDPCLLQYRCQVLAAAAVAACRRALIRNAELMAQGRGSRQELTRLIEEGFATLGA
jgi:AcrR family transcriptional regulator